MSLPSTSLMMISWMMTSWIRPRAADQQSRAALRVLVSNPRRLRRVRGWRGDGCGASVLAGRGGGATAGTANARCGRPRLCPDAAASDRGPNDCSRGGCRGKEQLVKKEAVVEAASAWLLAGRLAEIKN